MVSRVERARDIVMRRKQDYMAVFDSPKADRVLADLARFCRANDSCFHDDPRIHAVIEGRREVWLRIQKFLNLSPKQLYTLSNLGEEDNE